MKFFYLTIFLILAIAGCKEQFLEAPDLRNNLVVNSFFTCNDSTWINVSYLGNGLGIDSNVFCANAKVTLTEPDGTVHLFHTPGENEGFDPIYDMFSKEKGYYLLNEPIKYIKGLYKISVDVPGKNLVTAYDSIPEPVNFQLESSGYDKDLHSVFTISFDDPPETENFYAVYVSCRIYYKKNPLVQNGRNDTNCPNTFIEATDLQNQLYFSDKTFVGTKQDLLLNTSDYNVQFFHDLIEYKNKLVVNPDAVDSVDSIQYVIHLMNLSKSYYDYAISTYKQSLAEKDFYADPVIVYSNINVGTGIFAGYNQTTIIITYLEP